MTVKLHISYNQHLDRYQLTHAGVQRKYNRGSHIYSLIQQVMDIENTKQQQEALENLEYYLDEDIIEPETYSYVYQV